MPEIWFPHLNIEFTTLNRVCFSVFGIDVYWYGIFIAVAFLVGLQIAVINARRFNFDEELFYDYIPIGMIAAIIGARLYYVIFSFPYYKDHLNEIFSLRDGGLGVYGGIILAAITLLIFCKKKKVNFLSMCDLAVPGLALGQAIGRLGNFFNKEAFGGYTDNLFAMRIRTDVAAFIPKDMDIFSFNGADYIQVHPTFLYEGMLDVSIFIILMFYLNKKKFEGHILLLYMAMYSFGRFFIESLRQDQLMFMGIPISMAVSFVAFIFALVMIREKTRGRELSLERKCSMLEGMRGDRRAMNKRLGREGVLRRVSAFLLLASFHLP